MAIINFKITKLSGEKKEKEAKNVKAKANSKIVSMKINKDPSVGEYLAINFQYDVEYEPDLGNINLEGRLWYIHPTLKNVVKEEKEKIELKQEAVKEITTAIIRDCLLESLDVARKLQLPPPMQMPSVDVKPKQIKFKKAS